MAAVPEDVLKKMAEAKKAAETKLDKILTGFENRQRHEAPHPGQEPVRTAGAFARPEGPHPRFRGQGSSREIRSSSQRRARKRQLQPRRQSHQPACGLAEQSGKKQCLGSQAGVRDVAQNPAFVQRSFYDTSPESKCNRKCLMWQPGSYCKCDSKSLQAVSGNGGSRD